MRRVQIFVLGLLFIFGWTWAEEEKEEKKDPFAKESKNPLAHGFGDDIEWIDWENAIDKAGEESKPIFLLIHKSWCHACQLLKKKLDKASFQNVFKEMSQYFIMVNTEDDDEPWEEQYKPDGKYIPRLLFLDTEGDVLNVKNKKPEFEKYQHYYATPADILGAMEEVLNDYDIKIPEGLAKKLEKVKGKPKAKVEL